MSSIEIQGLVEQEKRNDLIIRLAQALKYLDDNSQNLYMGDLPLGEGEVNRDKQLEALREELNKDIEKLRDEDTQITDAEFAHYLKKYGQLAGEDIVEFTHKPQLKKAHEDASAALAKLLEEAAGYMKANIPLSEAAEENQLKSIKEGFERDAKFLRRGVSVVQLKDLQGRYTNTDPKEIAKEAIHFRLDYITKPVEKNQLISALPEDIRPIKSNEKLATLVEVSAPKPLSLGAQVLQGIKNFFSFIGEKIKGFFKGIGEKLGLIKPEVKRPDTIYIMDVVEDESSEDSSGAVDESRVSSSYSGIVKGTNPTGLPVSEVGDEVEEAIDASAPRKPSTKAGQPASPPSELNEASEENESTISKRH